MTPEQEALVEALRSVEARRWIEHNEAASLLALCLVHWVDTKTEGPSVQGRALVPTLAGRLVLALAAERDLWRLRSEWQEARAASYAAQLEYAELNPEMPHNEVSIEALNEADDTMMAAAEKRDAARAAYVAAGGEV